METTIKTRSFVLPSRVDSLLKLENELKKFWKKYSLPPHLRIVVQTALTEAFTNAIKHGNKMDSSKNVYISFAMEGQHLIVKVSDEGTGFDFSQYLKDDFILLSEDPYHRGIPIMKLLAESVSWQDNGSTCILTFNITTEEFNELSTSDICDNPHPSNLSPLFGTDP